MVFGPDPHSTDTVSLFADPEPTPDLIRGGLPFFYMHSFCCSPDPEMGGMTRPE
jgi:hypothetical protein